MANISTWLLIIFLACHLPATCFKNTTDFWEKVLNITDIHYQSYAGNSSHHFRLPIVGLVLSKGTIRNVLYSLRSSRQGRHGWIWHYPPHSLVARWSRKRLTIRCFHRDQSRAHRTGKTKNFCLFMEYLRPLALYWLSPQRRIFFPWESTRI